MQPFSVFGLTPYAVTGCHPFHGFHIFYYQTRGFRLRPAGYAETGTPLAMDMSPTDVGYKFRYAGARKLIDKFQFGEFLEVPKLEFSAADWQNM